MFDEDTRAFAEALEELDEEALEKMARLVAAARILNQARTGQFSKEDRASQGRGKRRLI